MVRQWRCPNATVRRSLLRARCNYPSRAQIAALFKERNAVPIFAIAHNSQDDSATTEIEFWRQFHGQSIGFGAVVPLSVDSSNLVQLLVSSLAQVNQLVAIHKGTDPLSLSVVKSMTNDAGGVAQYTAAVANTTVSFKVTLGSSTPVDGIVKLVVPGFGVARIEVSSCPAPIGIQLGPTCNSEEDRVRWVNNAVTVPSAPQSASGTCLVIGTVRGAVAGAGMVGLVAVQLDDAVQISDGVVLPLPSTRIVAFSCASRLFARNFNTTANVLAAFPDGRKVLAFATVGAFGSNIFQAFVSACPGDVHDACLDVDKPGCFKGPARTQLLQLAKRNATVARLLSISATSTCAPVCQNGGSCVFGECACTRDFTGARCETQRPTPPAVTVTASRITPGAGAAKSDVWLSGTTRTIKIPILSKDRSIPSGFARVMLLNTASSWRCRAQLPNGTIDGLPTWFFADSSEMDPASSPRYHASQLLAVIDISKLKWLAGTNAKATIEVQHTLSTDFACMPAGAGYRVLVMLSASRSDDASLLGPFMGGEFTLAIGGCIGDGVAGVCRSEACRSSNVAAKQVTAGQCSGANFCCIPDRTSTALPPVAAFTFLTLDVPRSSINSSAQFSWGESVPLKWRINNNRPAPSMWDTFWPSGFCALDEALGALTSSFELQLKTFSKDGQLIKSLGRHRLSAGGVDVPLELPQNATNHGAVVLVAKFSTTCSYASDVIPVTETPCFATATKTLVGTCMASCPTTGDVQQIGSCSGLKFASKCCGVERLSNNVGFKFEGEDEDEEGTVAVASAASLAVAGCAVVVAAVASI